MAKQLTVQVQKDHVESLASVSGSTALMQIIWNALDADATRIDIRRNGNEVKTESIEIHDNGHGINYERALDAFQKLGGSQKKEVRFSPGRRAFHGQEGKGRYNSFGLGDLIEFNSFYEDQGSLKFFQITLDRNNLTKPKITNLASDKTGSKTGVHIVIKNVNQKKLNKAFSDSAIKAIEQNLALYYQKYPTFEIIIDDRKLDFKSAIIDEYSEDFTISGQELKIRILQWSVSCEKKLFYCNENAIAFAETPLGIGTSGLNISAYLISDYIGALHRQGDLNVAELDYILNSAVLESKRIIKKFVFEKIHSKSIDFIKELKVKNLYPFKEDPQDEVENVTRQVFDILALNINEHIPNFSKQADSSKKLTLSLVKEALENDSAALQKIISEILVLPEDKMNDLKDLLETTSLSNVIDTMKEVTERLRLLYELKVVVMDPLKNKKVLERKHLHKILEKETWIFGDEYTLGASDVNLKNVLKAHLNALGRADFESVVDEGDNTDLDEIPDVCLWKQHNNGKPGHFRNLVIELKRPTVNAGTDEYTQIMKYAQKVSDDLRFEKDKTEWTFVLLVNDIKSEIRLQCEQQHRKFGHIHSSDKLNVYIIKWGTLFNENEARHQYLKEKLNFNITDNDGELKLLNARYEEYLPGLLKSQKSPEIKTV